MIHPIYLDTNFAFGTTAAIFAPSNPCGKEMSDYYFLLLAFGERDRQTETNGLIDKQIDIQRDRQTDRQTTDRQTYRQTEKQTE